MARLNSDLPLFRPSVSRNPSGSARRSAIEIHSIDHVPQHDRAGKLWHQGAFWFTLNATVLTVLSGVYGGLAGLSLVWSLVAIVVGSLIGTAFAAFHAVQGPRLGLPQMIQSRVQLGAWGANWILAVIVFMQTGFAVFFTILGRDSMGAVAGAGTGWYSTVIVVVGLLIAVFGYHSLHRVARSLTTLAVVVFILVTIALVTKGHFVQLLGTGSFEARAFLLQLGLSASYQITLAPMMSNYTRYLPRDTAAGRLIAWTFAGSAISAIWFESLGATVATSMPKQDFIVSLKNFGSELIPGLGTVLAVLTFLTMIAVVGVCLYEVMLSSLSVVDTFRRVKTSARLRSLYLVGAALVVWLLVRLLPPAYLVNYQDFLYLLLYFLIPWTAVNLTDFYLVRRERYAIAELLRPDGGIYGRLSARGLVAYWIGFAVMIPFFSNALYSGPVARRLGGSDISLLVGLPVSVVAFWVLMRGYDFRREERAMRVHSPITSLSAKLHFETSSKSFELPDDPCSSLSSNASSSLVLHLPPQEPKNTG